MRTADDDVDKGNQFLFGSKGEILFSDDDSEKQMSQNADHVVMSSSGIPVDHSNQYVRIANESQSLGGLAKTMGSGFMQASIGTTLNSTYGGGKNSRPNKAAAAVSTKGMMLEKNYTR